MSAEMGRYLETQQVRVIELEAILRFVSCMCSSDDARMLELAREVAETGHKLAGELNVALDSVNFAIAGAQ